MKSSLGILLMLTLPICCNAQTKPENIPPSRLQAILDSPDEGVAQRETYKVPLKSAYERQMGLSEKDCHAEADQGQQPYNICMGNAEQQADKDYATFYNNLQLLCHDQDQLKALQSSEQAWRIYLDAMEKAAHAAW